MNDAGRTPPDAGEIVARAQRLLAEGRAPAAVEALQRARREDPHDVDLLRHLARARAVAGQRLEALHDYEAIIRLGAADAGTWLETGHVLHQVGENAQALGAFERSVALDRRNARAHAGLATACFELGDADRSVKHLRRALAIEDLPEARVSLATLAPGAPGTSARQVLAIRRDLAAHLARQAATAPRQAMSPMPTRPPPPLRLPPPGERLRVGYLSAHFDRANYMKPVWALVNHHDRARVEVHLFDDRGGSRALPGYRRHPADVVHAVGALDDAALAASVARSGVHVLVDLSGYSVTRRLGAFLAPMAPVVIGWFNTFATSGLPGIDAVVGDAAVVTRREARHFSEDVLELPLSYLTFDVLHETPDVVDPPCLRSGTITFGSLVAQYKITPEVLDTWAAILKKAPGSRLFLANRTLASRHDQDWLVDAFARRGVDPSRLTLRGPAGHLEYLRHYDRIDLALDAFPYNGGTTTMEAIWQGVPVLTFDGDRWASRTSRSLLQRTHLARFVARSRRAMIREAVRLARDPGTPQMLRDLRRGMREALRSSEAMDAPRLAREMEALLAAAVERARAARC